MNEKEKQQVENAIKELNESMKSAQKYNSAKRKVRPSAIRGFNSAKEALEILCELHPEYRVEDISD